MKPRHRTYLLLAVPLLAVLIGVTLWQIRSPHEPVYDGKRLSVWLNELLLDPSKRTDPNTPPARAVRAIGTNAIPWLLRDLKSGPNQFSIHVNNWLLERQRLTSYRLPEGYERGARAAFGFWSLGPSAAPAIPDLMGLLKDRPTLVPLALSGIRPSAIPALQQCLTNTRPYTFPQGRVVILIPGEAICDIYNAISLGHISKSDAAVFLPAIRSWAQSTNTDNAPYAAKFLQDWHFSPGPEDTHELTKAGK